MEKAKALDLIQREYDKASEKFGEFKNAHEGYAVLLEEVDELWDAVKHKQSNPQRQTEMEFEAIQIGAMALRFLVDLIE